jgi:ketosteroid isomerase-like protein
MRELRRLIWNWSKDDTMIAPETALAMARDWIDAWNVHDLDAVMAHYADELEFVSPLVARRLNRPDGTIRTKRELRDYFSQSLGPDSVLWFELQTVLVGVTSFTTCYTNHRGQSVAEMVFPDAQGLIRRAYIRHAAAA